MKALSLKNLKCKMNKHDYEYLYSFLSTKGNVIFRGEILRCKNCQKHKTIKKSI